MGYSFGTVSKVELMGVHPKLVEVANLAISLTEQDFGVHDGLRTKVEQEKLVARGASKTMKSLHLRQADGFGHAVDLVPYINGKFRWEWGPIYYIAEAVHKAATQLNVALVWGAVWDRDFAALEGTHDGLEKAVKDYVKRRAKAGKSAFIDGPHYQLA